MNLRSASDPERTLVCQWAWLDRLTIKSARQREAKMRYYKSLCLIIAIDVALFSLVSLFYKPLPGTTTFMWLKYLFFVPLIAVSVLQVVGLLLNVMRGHVNTIGVTRFVVYRYDTSPLLFGFGVAWELFLWTLPMYFILEFLAGSR